MPHYKDTQNNVYWLDEHDDPAVWLPHCTPITDAEADDIRAKTAAAAFNNLSYADKRASKYPSIADQLDLMYHGGYDAWKAAIQSVKEEFPK